MQIADYETKELSDEPVLYFSQILVIENFTGSKKVLFRI